MRILLVEDDKSIADAQQFSPNNIMSSMLLLTVKLVGSSRQPMTMT